ncbi:MAG: hypothetical protein WBO10_07020 [Pyrinomonadaceae bacterium]
MRIIRFNSWLYVSLIIVLSISGSSAAEKANTDGNTVKGAVPEAKGVPDRFQQYPPGIMFATLLNSVKVNSRDGWLRLGNQMQNVFMPDGSTGKVVLSKADGSQICYWEWGLDGFGLKPPYKLFGFKQPAKPGGSRLEMADQKLTQPGKYVLDFYRGENKFYTFPFSIKTLSPDNAFDGNAIYLVDGAWNDWGYLFYSEADPEQNLVWKVWLRETEFTKKDHKVRIEVTRDKDKKLICQNRENTTNRFQHDWVRYDFDLVNPPVKTSGGAYFKAKDMLAVDGAYTLRMTMDGKPHGVWKFSVAGGKLNYTGKTVRGTADTMTFVEGGKDAWWYLRQDG